MILFQSYGYDDTFTSVDYSTGSYAALGNYLAQEIIAFGLQDNSNEVNDYDNLHYSPINEPLILELYEDNLLDDPDRWQPLAFDVFIDQSGNPFPADTPDFLSPEWGQVTPFALKVEDLQILNNGFDSYIYNDPGAPEYIQSSTSDGINDPYKWHFALVIAWSAHLDPADNTEIDISPGGLGNVGPICISRNICRIPSLLQFYRWWRFGNWTCVESIYKCPVCYTDGQTS